MFPTELNDWIKQANNAYQSVKHLDREMPPIGKLAEINDRTSLVIQIWLADRLGATEEDIKAYVSSNPRMSSSFVKIPDPSEPPLRLVPIFGGLITLRSPCTREF